MNKTNLPDNTFITLSYFYISIYSVFLIFGYSVLSDIINNKKIKIVSFDNNKPTFILKRFLALSLMTILFSSITFSSLNVNLYIISLLLHIVSIIGYRIYFTINDLLTYFIHILLAIPIFALPYFITFYGVISYNYILLLLVFLLFYKMCLFDYVY
jgi:hypothetical protein